MSLTNKFAVLIFTTSIAFAQNNQMRTKIVAPQLCGFVTDISGVPIAKATVSAMIGDVGSSVVTDESGRWMFAGDAGSRWIYVHFRGFESMAFDYSSRPKQKSDAGNEPAFLGGTSPNTFCKTPIYVRLDVMNSTKGFVTLDSRKGLITERDTH